MPSRPCPHCLESTPRHLPYSSALAVADYYRCDTCGYVFTVEKAHPEGPIRAVTTHEPPYERARSATH
jgi:transposase-like protein